MVGLAVVLFAFASTNAGSGAQYTQTWRQSAPLEAGGELEVDEQYGDVKVESGQSGTVQIEAVKHADRQSTLNAINIHVDTIQGAVKIVTDYPSQWHFLHREQTSVDFDIHVPRGTRVILRLKYGDGRIVSVSAPVDAQTRYGDITVVGGSGDATISSTYGDVALSVAKTDAAAHIMMRTTYGNVTVELPAGSKPRVDAATKLGSIDNDFDNAANIGPALELKTTFGDVTVREEAAQ